MHKELRTQGEIPTLHRNRANPREGKLPGLTPHFHCHPTQGVTQSQPEFPCEGHLGVSGNGTFQQDRKV